MTFIWKYEKDDDFTSAAKKTHPNIYFTKWMPQNDLLSEFPGLEGVFR